MRGRKTWRHVDKTSRAAMLLDKLRVIYFVLHGVLALLIDAQSIAPDVSGDLYQIYERYGLTALV